MKTGHPALCNTSTGAAGVAQCCLGDAVSFSGSHETVVNPSGL